MLKKRTKNKNSLLYIIVFLLYFICSINVCNYAASTVIGPGANIKSNTKATTEPETTHPKGFKVENAQYYDYVGYDDQGRLVDKNNIIIGKGSGGSGQGGGSFGDGNKGADSSGAGGNGTSGYTASQTPGQGGSGVNVADDGKQLSNNDLKKKQAAEEVARQYRASQLEYNESIKESILYKARAQNPTSSKKQVIEKKTVVETEAVTYKQDDVTKAPVKQTEKVLTENQMHERTSQPRPVFDDTIPTVIVPEKIEETTINTPDKNLPEVQLNVPTVTFGPEDMIEETIVIESEVVTIEETIVKPTAPNQIKESKKQEITIDEKKKGDKGEKNHDDEDAEYKKELGINKEDGKGDGQGGVTSGVKIFEFERKGNLGVTEKAGINNIERLIAGIVISLLLLIGVAYYYIPYIFKPKNSRSNYIS